MEREKLEQELRDFFRAEVKRFEPSHEWWGKALSQVDERKLSTWERFSSWLSQPAWRTVTATVLVVVLAFGVLWGTGVLPGLQNGKVLGPAPGTTVPATTAVPRTTTPPTTTTPPLRSLKVTAATDKASYLPGERVELVFSLTNITQEPLALKNFPPYTEIARKGILVRTFERGSREVRLGTGETATYNLVWDQLDSKGQPVNPASYEVASEYITITKGSPSIMIQESYHEIATVDITFPQGAMEKTIDVNQSQTVNGITITLERVELSATEMKVFVLKTPGYTPRPNEPPSRTDIADIRGTYQVDDGAKLNTFSWRYQSLEGSDRVIWEGLYPVPSNAQTLLFTISRLSIAGKGDFGPWEFKVKLN